MHKIVISEINYHLDIVLSEDDRSEDHGTANLVMEKIKNGNYKFTEVELHLIGEELEQYLKQLKRQKKWGFVVEPDRRIIKTYLKSINYDYDED